VGFDARLLQHIAQNVSVGKAGGFAEPFHWKAGGGNSGTGIIAEGGAGVSMGRVRIAEPPRRLRRHPLLGKEGRTLRLSRRTKDREGCPGDSRSGLKSSMCIS
jgi:hypothetical protein